MAPALPAALWRAALLAAVGWCCAPCALLLRLARNALLTPDFPRPVEPRYSLANPRLLAHDITIVVGTKVRASESD